MWKLPESDTYFKSILEKTPEGFEIDHLEFALKHCKQFRLAVDGGAHVGTWTVRMAQDFAYVLALEPAEDTFACLLENLSAHEHTFKAKVEAMNMALGPESGVCSVEEDPTRLGNTGSRVINPKDRFGFTPMIALDSWGLYSLDFLKLDVEGFELGALSGAVETLRRCKPTVMIECKKFNPPRYGGPELAVKFLEELGYKGVGGIRNDQVFVYG